MPQVTFTRSLERHLAAPARAVGGKTVREALEEVYRHGLDVDASGERVAVGSTIGSLWISEDGGDAWRLLSAHLPPIYQVAFAR